MIDAGALQKHTIDHVLPSGVGWEASVAQWTIQRWWN